MKAMAAAASLALTLVAGCAADRRGDVDSINAAITQLPGVASSAPAYDSGWRRGDRHFGLTAVLRDDATPQQAQAIGATFTDLVNARDFSAFEVDLEVKYRVVDAMNHVPLTSSAAFALGEADSPTSAVVSDSLREWLDIARSPGVQSARLGERVGVTIDQAATDGDLQTLLKNHPDLDSATWTVVGGSLRQVSINDPDYPEAYDVVGMLPDETLRALWGRIVAEVGAAGEVSAKTDMAQKDPAKPPTTVNVNFPTSRDREQNLAQAWMALPLLEKMPLPARVDFDGAVFVIGGCSATGPGSSALETELRHKYEKC